MELTAENSIGDYWEDSSVSWGCRGLSFPSCMYPPTQVVHSEGSVDGNPSYMHNFCTAAASTLRPRNFPPPITFCTMLSTIKSGGRFVLKEMAALPPHSLRAEREQGRLCLHMIEPLYVDEDDNCGEFCSLENDLECMDPHEQEQDDAGYEVLGTEDISVSILSHEKADEGLIRGMPQEPVCVGGEALSCGMPDACTCMEHVRTTDDSVATCVLISMAHADVESKGLHAKTHGNQQ